MSTRGRTGPVGLGQRNLLYTAVTRAKQKMVLYSDPWLLERAVAIMPVKDRTTFLKHRLQEGITQRRREVIMLDFLRPSEIFLYTCSREEYMAKGIVGTVILQYRDPDTKEVALRFALSYGMADQEQPGFLRYHTSVRIRSTETTVVQFEGAAFDELAAMLTPGARTHP